MNYYTIFFSNKKEYLKAKTPKQCAKLFIQKYPKFNQKFSIYSHSNKKIYGFFHKNHFIQSGGTNVKMLYKKNNNLIKSIHNISDNDINELKKRNNAYSTISIPLNASFNDFKDFGSLLITVKNDDKFKYLIKDFLKTIIYKLQFISNKNKLENYLNIIKNFGDDTIIKDAVGEYLPHVKNKILNSNKIKKNIQYQDIINTFTTHTKTNPSSGMTIRKMTIQPPIIPLNTLSP